MSKVYCGLVRIHFEVRECEEGAVEVTHAQTVLVRKSELFTPDYPTLLHAERALEAVKEAISIGVHEPLRVWDRDTDGVEQNAGDWKDAVVYLKENLDAKTFEGLRFRRGQLSMHDAKLIIQHMKTIEHADLVIQRLKENA